MVSEMMGIPLSNGPALLLPDSRSSNNKITGI
jgi:hypothetical protein